LVKDGDYVEKERPTIAEVDSDKATLNYLRSRWDYHIESGRG
jgi:hypothetical protein